MRQKITSTLLTLLSAVLLLTSCGGATTMQEEASTSPADYVNPLVGTLSEFSGK